MFFGAVSVFFIFHFPMATPRFRFVGYHIGDTRRWYMAQKAELNFQLTDGLKSRHVEVSGTQD